MPLYQLTYEPDDEILSTLIRADGLIPSPEKWWRGKSEKWWRGKSDEDTHKHCVLTSLYDARPGGLNAKRRSLAKSYLLAALPAGWDCLPDYNDAPETTFDDIKSLYARAENLRRAELRERV